MQSHPDIIIIDDSDGFTSGGDEDGSLVNTPFVQAQWPLHVASLNANYNPGGIPLPFTYRFGECVCRKPCRFRKCRNASLGIYCAPKYCPFNGHCGNGLSEHPGLRLVQHLTTLSYGVVASVPIKKGVIIGEYLGRILMVPPPKQRVQNRGYRFVLRETPAHCGRWRACVDAESHGSLMRFVNHSCEPTARFHEVGNGSHRTVVVATLQPIRADEEDTVNYGNDLWFVCKCGRRGCIHKDIQD